MLSRLVSSLCGPYLTVFRQLPGLYLLLRPNLVIVEASDALLAVTTTSRDDIVGRHVFLAFPPNESGPVPEAIRGLPVSVRKVLETRTVDEMFLQRYDVQGPDGVYQERYWQCSNWPIVDQTGKVCNILHEVRDVTEVDLAANLVAESEKRRQTEERFRLLVDGVKDYAIYRLDRDGRVETWSEAAQRIKGWTTEEVVGQNFDMFFTQEDREAGKPQQELRLAAQNGRYQEEGWRVRKNGSQFWASVVVTPLRGPNDEIVGFAKITQDLTQKKEAEDAARKLTEVLRIRIEALEGFNNSVCHDLNAPLRAMEGFAEAVIQDYDDIDPRLTEFLERIQDAAKRMRLLLTDLLRLSRVSREDLSMVVTTFSLTDLAREIVAVERTYPDNFHHEVVVVEDLEVCGDRDLVKLLLQAVLDNAFKFSRGREHPFIKVGKTGGEFYVSDNGIGFEQSVSGRLFRPFSRLHSASEYAGTGIGLSIAKRVADLHDGSIRAVGTPDRGATFFFTFSQESRCHAAD